MPRIIVFASGDAEGGGSGFQELVENSRTKDPVLDADIVAVVSNHEFGGVRKRADALEIPFIHMTEFSSSEYNRLVHEQGADWVALSGWLKLTKGLNPKIAINIHPGDPRRFGGRGWYGHYVHDAVIAAFKRGEVGESAVAMHFVTERYDEGPIFFYYPVLIRENDTPESLAARVNKIEHSWQSYITNLVVHRQIYWDGKNPQTLTVPQWYQFAIHC